MAHPLSHEKHAGYRLADKTDWRAAIWAGVIAGIVFMMMEMIMVMIFEGQSPWAPPRMMAAMALGKDVLPPPADFDLKIMMTAMAIHFPLSVILGLIAGWIVHRLDIGIALLVGAVTGLAVYFVNFHLIAPAAFPWFVQSQGWISVMSHMVFGIVLTGAYAGLRKSTPAEAQ